jgi:hypothetical protein
MGNAERTVRVGDGLPQIYACWVLLGYAGNCNGRRDDGSEGLAPSSSLLCSGMIMQLFSLAGECPVPKSYPTELSLPTEGGRSNSND